jgi:hypothetical protein
VQWLTRHVGFGPQPLRTAAVPVVVGAEGGRLVRCQVSRVIAVVLYRASVACLAANSGSGDTRHTKHLIKKQKSSAFASFGLLNLGWVQLL